MSIQDYYNYQVESEAQEPQNVTDEHGMIKFAVNIDIEEWKKEMHELQSKLPKEFLFNSEFDAMQYSTQKIKGINLPQLYMKVSLIIMEIFSFIRLKEFGQEAMRRT